MFPKEIILIIVSINVALSQRMEDPLCTLKACPSDTTCRVVTECSKPQSCVLKAECLANPPQWSHTGVCQVGDPILVMKNGVLEDTTCGPRSPCPDTAYCNTELMDTYATCCRSDPGNPVKPGACPASTNTDTFFCVDKCNNDGDCRYDAKCCQDGCRKACVNPKPVNPCENKVCGPGTYCLTPDIPPCMGPGQCYTVGDCVPCGETACDSNCPHYVYIKDSRGCSKCTCMPPPPLVRPAPPTRPMQNIRPPQTANGNSATGFQGTNGNSATGFQGTNGNPRWATPRQQFISPLWYYLMNLWF